MTKTTIKDLKLGEYFCLFEYDDSQTEVPSSKVWVRGPYDHSEKKYEIYKFDDTNTFRLVRGTVPCYNEIYF